MTVCFAVPHVFLWSFATCCLRRSRADELLMTFLVLGAFHHPSVFACKTASKSYFCSFGAVPGLEQASGQWAEKSWGEVRREEISWEDVRRVYKMWEEERRDEKTWDELTWAAKSSEGLRQAEVRWDGMRWDGIRQWDAIRNFQEKVPCDEITWDEKRTNLEKKKRCRNEMSRDRSCDSQKAWPHPVGTVFLAIYRL